MEKEGTQKGRQFPFDDRNELQRALGERSEVDIHNVHQKRRDMFILECIHTLRDQFLQLRLSRLRLSLLHFQLSLRSHFSPNLCQLCQR